MGELVSFKENKPVENQTICNCCGLPISRINKFELSFIYPYMSKRDYDLAQIQLHTECLDQLTDKMISSFKVNPIHEYTGQVDNPYNLKMAKNGN